MHRLLTLAVASCCLSLSSVVAAQECSTLLDSKIAPVMFDKAVSLLSKSGAGLVKDEFETTAQFEARQAAAGGTPSAMFVTLPIDLKHVNYNADAGLFEIKSFSLENTGPEWYDIVYGTPYQEQTENAISKNISIIVSSNDKIDGTYTRRNEYGASWEVTSISRTANVILEKVGTEYGKQLWGKAFDTRVQLWKIPVPVEKAREFKSKLRAAALIAPVAPFFFKNKQPSTTKSTVQYPYYVTVTTRVIVADIQCVAFTDNANNVLLSVKTN